MRDNRLPGIREGLLNDAVANAESRRKAGLVGAPAKLGDECQRGFHSRAELKAPDLVIDVVRAADARVRGEVIVKGRLGVDMLTPQVVK